MRRRWRLVAGSLLLVSGGCVSPAPEAIEGVPAMHGTVTFTGARRAQAQLSEVGDRATVSLINASLNRTDATTVTTASGGFVLTFSRTFRPSATDSYYLEAVKGLGANLPGNNAARVRTLARYQGGWLSLTNGLPGQGAVDVDDATTAIAVVAALRHQNPTPIGFVGLMGSYDSQTRIYAPQPGVSAQDVATVRLLASDLLAANGDPVAGVKLLLPNTWVKEGIGQSLAISAIVPASASVGATVSISGTGFSSTPASNSVAFNGALATVNQANPNALVVTVPIGARTGPVRVGVGELSTSTPSFWVAGTVIGGISTGSSGVTNGSIGAQ